MLASQSGVFLYKSHELGDHLSYVTIFASSLGRYLKTGLTVRLRCNGFITSRFAQVLRIIILRPKLPTALWIRKIKFTFSPFTGKIWFYSKVIFIKIHDFVLIGYLCETVFSSKEVQCVTTYDLIRSIVRVLHLQYGVDVIYMTTYIPTNIHSNKNSINLAVSFMSSLSVRTTPCINPLHCFLKTEVNCL